MEAKDTVMDFKQFRKVYSGKEWKPVVELQAEITWAKATEFLDLTSETQYRSGIKEAVEWIEENAPHYQCKECGYEQHLDDDWHAKKKEWGIA